MDKDVVCVRVCVYVYTYTVIYVYVYMYIRIHTHTHTHTMEYYSATKKSAICRNMDGPREYHHTE